ncbi:Tox-REase-5 domain-containing protein [Sinomonas albida]|uniref:Tox-REase-5 domain-containing protein n=1 Tax=Sinomonas albida TaxID=369942 RepID=UPI0010A8D572|nr:Tox-REase-5 domain-containing protein [Sinomonas albida]
MRTVADGLVASRRRIAAGADGVEAAWAGLPAVFESPEAAIVYRAMEPANRAARDFAGRLDAVSRTLEEYADRIQPIKAELAAVRADAAAFVDEVGPDGLVWVNASETKRYEFDALATAGMGASGMVDGAAMGALLSPQDPVDYLISKGETARSGPDGPQILAPWHESGSYVDRNNRLLDRVADAYAKLSQAEADCADEINRQRTGGSAPVARVEAWELKQSGAEAVDLPWGQRADEDRNCGESMWWGAGNALKETSQGLGGLAVGYDPQRNEYWRGDAYASAWKGFGLGIGSLALSLNPLAPILGSMGVPVFKEANENVQAMAKSLVAWDTWGKNPGEALGMAAVGIGGFLVPGPGEAAGALKGAGVAAKLAKGSKTAEEAAQGGKAAEDAAASAGKTAGHATESIEQRLADREKTGADVAGQSGHARETLSDLGTRETQLDLDGLSQSELPGHSASDTRSVDLGIAGSADGGNSFPRSDSEVHLGPGVHASPDETGRLPRDPYAPGLHHPGGDPPRTPASGDSDGSAGTWEYIKRNSPGEEWKVYQEQIAGIRRNAQGYVPEYLVPREFGKPVQFDGHVWRGRPPREIFLEAKDGYGIMVDPAKPRFFFTKHGQEFIEQARSQAEAVRRLCPEARIEWHFSNRDVADAVRDVFLDSDISVEVYYTPKA